jgi:hypothetical protein
MRRRLGVMLAAAVVVLAARHAAAQTPEELAAARSLFGEALTDEEHHRYAEALEKYKRVVQVRETTSVRYRMGLTLEGLGRVNEAIESHAAAVRLAAGSPKDAEIAKASKARLEALEPRVAHLALKVTPSGTAGTPPELKVDDKPVEPEHADDVRVDPGQHVVTATAPGAQPFRAQVTLSDGGRAEIPISLQAAVAPPPQPPPPPPPPPPKESGSLRTVGIITGGAGAAFLVAGGIVMILRASAISSLKDACGADGNNCPIQKKSELDATHSRAVTETTVGAILLTTGAIALAAGVVLYVVGGNDKTTAAFRMPMLAGATF